MTTRHTSSHAPKEQGVQQLKLLRAISAPTEMSSIPHECLLPKCSNLANYLFQIVSRGHACISLECTTELMNRSERRACANTLTFQWPVGCRNWPVLFFFSAGDSPEPCSRGHGQLAIHFKVNCQLQTQTHARIFTAGANDPKCTVSLRYTPSK